MNLVTVLTMLSFPNSILLIKLIGAGFCSFEANESLFCCTLNMQSLSKKKKKTCSLDFDVYCLSCCFIVYVCFCFFDLNRTAGHL